MPQPHLEISSQGRWFRLLAATAVVAGIWLVGLPRLAEQPAVRHYIDDNEARGIDPSAKFYTELPGMPAFYSRVQDARRRDRAAFGLE